MALLLDDEAVTKRCVPTEGLRGANEWTIDIRAAGQLPTVPPNDRAALLTRCAPDRRDGATTYFSYMVPIAWTTG